jgi:transcriptional regulator with XRE-family HTH domain
MENNNVQFEIGSKIRFFRELKGISQLGMATHLNISQQAYQKIESGVTKLDLERAEKIAKELEVDLATLMNFSPANYWYNCTLSGNATITGKGELHIESQAHIETLKEMIEMLRKENAELRARKE